MILYTLKAQFTKMILIRWYCILLCQSMDFFYMIRISLYPFLLAFLGPTLVNDAIEPTLDYFMDAQHIIRKHASTISRHQIVLAIISVLCVVLIFLFNDLNGLLVFAKNVTSSFVFFYSLMSVIFVKTIEKKSLKNTLDSLNVTANLFFSPNHGHKKVI